MVELKNYMEVCVKEAVGPVIKNMGGCTCENCVYDVSAIALNSLPPKYVVTREGAVYSKIRLLQQQFDVDVIAAISKAVEIVKASPRHNN